MKKEKTIGKNPFKGFDTRTTRYAPGEYKVLIDALSEGRNNDVLDIVYKIYLRGHFL